MRQRYRILIPILFSAVLFVACSNEEDSTTTTPAPATTPDSANQATTLVFTNGYIYTVEAERRGAEAVAVMGNKIVHVGSNESIQPYIGTNTDVRDLNGRMLLPGLHDMHVHATGLAEPSMCNLEGDQKPMEELVPFLKGCLESEQLSEGEWLVVVGWASGNEPSDRYKNMRMTLDAVSDKHPIVLWSSHSGAFNSPAFAQAKDLEGNIVGMNRETLPTVYTDVQEMISVDETGEPTGKVVEEARDYIRNTVFEDVMGLNQPADYAMPAVAKILAQSGITSIQDPMSVARTLELYDWFEKSGNMSFRVRAHFYSPPHATSYINDPNIMDQISDQVAHFKTLRAQYSDSEFIQANGVKFFMDGGLYGAPHPLPEPPTLPSTGMLSEFKQPLFSYKEDGSYELMGYVDLDSDTCVDVRDNPKTYQGSDAISRFIEEQGYHPAQCTKTSGQLGHGAEYVHEYVRQMTEAGLHIHVHSDSDKATRVLTDAFAAHKALADEKGVTQTIAHAQLIHPDDVKRLGQLGVYISTTYSWFLPHPGNISVIPFIDEVDGADDLFNMEHYYMQNVFPVKSLKGAGTPLAWGSDSPQGLRDPIPFVNMETAITREFGEHVLNANERLNVHEVIASFTIEGARLMGHDDRLGSIEVGKIADLVILSQNVVALAEQGEADKISDTRVDLTLFNGKVIYERAE